MPAALLASGAGVQAGAPRVAAKLNASRNVQKTSASLGRKAFNGMTLQSATPTRIQKRANAPQITASSLPEEDMYMPPSDLIMPGDSGFFFPTEKEFYRHQTTGGAASPAAVSAGGYDDHRPKTPPPDLPSLLLDSRIVYVGMPLVSAVTELVVAEILYLNWKDRQKSIYMYVNSTGCSRADGETVGFETEGTAIYDTMSYVANDIETVGVGAAIGQACMLLAAGAKGKRYMLPHATAMLHQPRVPSTGQRQAIEIAIRWKEVFLQKQNYMRILAHHTGQPQSVLERDIGRPLYMQPKDAKAYGVIDHVLEDNKAKIDSVKGRAQWDKDAGLVERPAPGAGAM